MKTPINVLVPCRAGSQRVPGKNTSPFSNEPDGLIGRKLRQLAQVEDVHRVVVSTDDPKVKAIALDLKENLDSRILVLDRPNEYAIADTLDAFVEHVAEIMPAGIVAWTHVTSPFFGAAHYEQAFHAYRNKVEAAGLNDSLMAVKAIRNFVWRNNTCISHNRSTTKWPQTQDIEPFYEVNSALFMYDREAMRRDSDRIGTQPYLHETDEIASFDIDWPEDFQLAEAIEQQQQR